MVWLSPSLHGRSERRQFKNNQVQPSSKKSSVVLQDLDESATKDTIIHDEYYNGGGDPVEVPTVMRMLECFRSIWIDLLHSRNVSVDPLFCLPRTCRL